MRDSRGLAIVAVVLAACQSPAAYGPDSPWYRYPPGVAVVVEKPFDIPAGDATVRLQSGQIVARNSVQEQEPFCVLESLEVAAAPQRVEPDRFEVVRVVRSISSIADGMGWVSPAVRVRFGGDDGPSFLYFQTRFDLRSPRQPEIVRLTCMANQNAAGNSGRMRHLTLPEIRAAIAGVLRIELPPS